MEHLWFLVRCRSRVVAPRFDRTGTSFVEESSVAVWVGDVSLTLFAPIYCVESNAHLSR